MSMLWKKNLKICFFNTFVNQICDGWLLCKDVDPVWRIIGHICEALLNDCIEVCTRTNAMHWMTRRKMQLWLQTHWCAVWSCLELFLFEKLYVTQSPFVKKLLIWSRRAGTIEKFKTMNWKVQAHESTFAKFYYHG